MKESVNVAKKRIRILTALACVWFLRVPVSSAPAARVSSPPLKALIVTGQNNHNWKVSSAVLKKILEETSLFQVDLAVSPPAGGKMKNFKPGFSAYRLVVLDYNGDPWPRSAQRSFVEFVRGGGGVVVYHAADNAFPAWPEYNEIIGLGGWGARNEKAGPYVFWKAGQAARDDNPGIAGYHTPPHEFLVVNRDTSHPVTAGLPRTWVHARDELYSLLRGPAKKLHVLATANSSPEERGTGRDEPVLFTVSYGAGRIFHTTLGHTDPGDSQPALECVGFIVTFQRGSEWAATGRVTQEIPGDFPGTDLDSPTPADVRRWPGFRPPSLESILKDLAGFEYGQNDEPLYKLRAYILEHRGSPESREDGEKALLAFLESGATLPAKMAACRQLRLVGTEKSVPVLEKMLIQNDTADMARYALEKIPGAQAESALLDALGKTQAGLKIGLISSLGQRKSPTAVPALGSLLDGEDKALARAAAVALGQVGNAEVAAILCRALDRPGGDVTTDVASALLRCAAGFMVQGKSEEAVSLYEKLLSAELPAVFLQAAMKGKIAASGKEQAARLITDALSRSPEVWHSPAIGLIPEVFDPANVAPVCGLLAKLPEASQLQLLSVLSKFPGDAVLPSFVEAAQSRLPAVRTAALKAIGAVGDASMLPLLARRAALSQDEEQEAARNSLYSLRGPDVDEAILFGLVSQADEAVKAELLRAVAERRIHSGKELALGLTYSPTARNRLEALRTLKVIASPDDLPALLSRLLEIPDESEQEEMETTIAGVAQKISDPYSRAAAAEKMLGPGEGTGQEESRDLHQRCLLYRVLGKIGDDSSLPLLRTALADENLAVVDAAVRALADWPDIAARHDLFAVATSSSSLVHKVLALRAYVRMVSLEPHQSPQQAVQSLRSVLEVSARPEEKRLVLSVLPEFPCPEGLRLAESMLGDEDVKEEAQAAVDQIKEKLAPTE
jgi:HEAT repeat protein/type 1 glutamine amidotransferase